MSDLLESTSESLRYKFYADATIDPSTAAVPATDPAITGGQILRHVSHNLSLTKDTYSADEVRTDKQRPMEKSGTRRVPGTINCLLSAKTHEDLVEACLGGTWTVAAITGSQTDFTSAACDNSTSKITFVGGDPVSVGFRVGDIINFASLSDTDNNGKNFVILGFSGSSNRVVEVYPAPDTMSADTSFTITTVGRSLYMPASAHVKRKVALEVYNTDGDISRLFTEMRFAGFSFSVAPNQNAQINYTLLGRDRYVYSGASAPFFTAPTAETATDLISSMDGLLRINGVTVGVCTGLSFSFMRSATAPAQLSAAGLTAGVLLANATITGEFTVFLKDTTFLDAFGSDTEMELLAYLPASNGLAPAAMTFYLPRIKLTSNNETTIDGAKAVQCGFTAAKYLGSAPGVVATSIRITDTDVT